MQQYLIPLIIGLVVGGIVLASLLSQLHSVSQKHEASDYVNPGSMKLVTKYDNFINKETERLPIQRQTPPQGGAGSSGPRPPQGPGARPQGGSGLTVVPGPNEKH